MLYEMLIIYQLLPMRAKKCQDQKNKDYTTNYFLKTHILRKLGRPTEWEKLEKEGLHQCFLQCIKKFFS